MDMCDKMREKAIPASSTTTEVVQTINAADITALNYSMRPIAEQNKNEHREEVETLINDKHCYCLGDVMVDARTTDNADYTFFNKTTVDTTDLDPTPEQMKSKTKLLNYDNYDKHFWIPHLTGGITCCVIWALGTYVVVSANLHGGPYIVGIGTYTLAGLMALGVIGYKLERKRVKGFLLDNEGVLNYAIENYDDMRNGLSKETKEEIQERINMSKKPISQDNIDQLGDEVFQLRNKLIDLPWKITLEERNKIKKLVL